MSSATSALLKELEELGGDPYEICQVEVSISANELEKRVRKRKLVLHPDKNRDDPNAASKFDQLQKAFEFLKDNKKRADLDQYLKAKEEARKRHEKADSQKRKFKEELERRETAAASSSSSSSSSFTNPSAQAHVDHLREQTKAQLKKFSAAAPTSAGASAAAREGRAGATEPKPGEAEKKQRVHPPSSVFGKGAVLEGLGSWFASSPIPSAQQGNRSGSGHGQSHQSGASGAAPMSLEELEAQVFAEMGGGGKGGAS
uniref:J domain-containing protein n=1 Tax=Chromera velia CCMP2878 TaxID=1169474 RepID=A0A0G4H9M1_9ALVE|mmetsp:Transcript_9032/g.17678  ORF Transcript_9032/g.17678 Transcript_9032/m.17678 type:complete len:258 (+) Transcript_9032:129-902(+)|eukprot:Cvel_6002.t1-p1 / transcript=Cvel_6002.t1 / gene=Cvel_6002 / organism=Chromera_velia_CCMP2878 / gene_product=Chaperone protein DnaJ, putative / transcript_product=Chaperone protein DnaJ, putative / location=Cvel_scaffold287:65397-66167(+) / protein_length=257 / sequence_SO=supercontig / SO=protein_coding / is_pseudo=false